MNSSQIHKILSRDPISSRHYAGVYPSDKIPIIHKFPSAIVLNTGKHYERGTHWLAVYIQDKKTIEFFDSYGLPPEFYGEDISNFVRKYHYVQANKIPLQSLTSNVCGQYCLYFIVKRCQGVCMRSIVTQLMERKNDFRMFQFVKKRYGVHMIF